MNTPTTSKPDLEGLRRAVQEYQLNPHRVPLNGLKPVHDSILELRKQNVSYAANAVLLQQHGFKTSRARVAEYGRIVLESGKSRKQRKCTRTMPPINTLVTTQSAPAVAAKSAPTTAPGENGTPQAKERSPYHRAYENHGSPFLELVQPIDSFTVQVMPITINHDFFASVLGGRRDLGHHIIYFEPEMQWYCFSRIQMGCLRLRLLRNYTGFDDEVCGRNAWECA